MYDDEAWTILNGILSIGTSYQFNNTSERKRRGKIFLKKKGFLFCFFFSHFSLRLSSVSYSICFSSVFYFLLFILCARLYFSLYYNIKVRRKKNCFYFCSDEAAAIGIARRYIHYTQTQRKRNVQRIYTLSSTNEMLCLMVVFCILIAVYAFQVIIILFFFSSLFYILYLKYIPMVVRIILLILFRVNIPQFLFYFIFSWMVILDANPPILIWIQKNRIEWKIQNTNWYASKKQLKLVSENNAHTHTHMRVKYLYIVLMIKMLVYFYYDMDVNDIQLECFFFCWSCSL